MKLKDKFGNEIEINNEFVAEPNEFAVSSLPSARADNTRDNEDRLDRKIWGASFRGVVIDGTFHSVIDLTADDIKQARKDNKPIQIVYFTVKTKDGEVPVKRFFVDRPYFNWNQALSKTEKRMAFLNEALFEKENERIRRDLEQKALETNPKATKDNAKFLTWKLQNPVKLQITRRNAE